MRLHRLRLRGFATPFAHTTVEVDFDALPEGLVALVGENGAGKSTLLEAVPAVLFKLWPSYSEGLADHVAPGVRDAMIELRWSLGDVQYRSLAQVDPLFGGGRGKTELYLWRGDTPVAGPLVRDYEAAIATLLPPAELFLASAFACQGGDGSFFGLSTADRKALFAEMLGLGSLQALADRAKGRGQSGLAELEAARTKADGAGEVVGRAVALDGALAEARRDVAAAEAEQSRATAAATEAQRRADAARAALERARAAREALRGEAERIEAERRRLEARLASLRQERATLLVALADRDDVEAAAARLAGVEAAARAAEERERAVLAELAPVEAELARLTAERDALRARYEEAHRAHQAAEEAASVLGELPAIRTDLEVAEESIQRDTAAIAALDARLPAAEADAERERQATERGALLRSQQTELGRQAELLDVIPGVPECATCPLTASAREAEERCRTVAAELAALPQPNGAAAALARLKHERREHEMWLGKAQRVRAAMAAKLAELAGLEERARALPALAATLEEVRTAGLAVKAALEVATARRDDLAAARNDAAGARHETAQAWNATRAAAERLPEILAAVARLPAVEDELAETEAACALLPATVLTAGEPPEADAAREAAAALVDAQAALSQAEVALRAATSRADRLAGERAALDPLPDAAALQARADALATESAEWALLERALGPQGAQALEIDAAGPSVTSVANELLASCYGPRFSLALDTTAMTKDGKKQREVFDVRILDAEAGRTARRGSGGEQVVLDEALRLALAIVNSQRSGCELRTLFRDETAGALSPENADRYVAMLRRARDLGGFDKVLFIAHQPAVWEQADAKLLVEGGKVSVLQ